MARAGLELISLRLRSALPLNYRDRQHLFENIYDSSLMHTIFQMIWFLETLAKQNRLIAIITNIVKHIFWRAQIPRFGCSNAFLGEFL